MPYIKKNERSDYAVFGLEDMSPENCGHLNYVFTKIIQSYLAHKGESYQTYNDIVGALDCCKMELYRRKIVPYEDKKIKENGDCY